MCLVVCDFKVSPTGSECTRQTLGNTRYGLLMERLVNTHLIHGESVAQLFEIPLSRGGVGEFQPLAFDNLCYLRDVFTVARSF